MYNPILTVTKLFDPDYLKPRNVISDDFITLDVSLPICKYKINF